MCRKTIRRWLAALSLLQVVVAGLVLGVAGYQQSSASMRVEIRDVSITNGNVTAITLRLLNGERTAVHPIYRVPSTAWHIQDAWDVVDGPASIPAGESATVTIAAPGEAARPPMDDSALVIISERSSERRVVRGPLVLGAFDADRVHPDPTEVVS